MLRGHTRRTASTIQHSGYRVRDERVTLYNKTNRRIRLEMQLGMRRLPVVINELGFGGRSCSINGGERRFSHLFERAARYALPVFQSILSDDVHDQDHATVIDLYDTVIDNSGDLNIARTSTCFIH